MLRAVCSQRVEDAEQVDATNAGDQRAQDATATSNPDGAGKILVAYYSAQGRTRHVAEAAADEMAGRPNRQAVPN